jgi:hypothetical protein
MLIKGNMNKNNFFSENHTRINLFGRQLLVGYSSSSEKANGCFRNALLQNQLDTTVHFCNST